VLPQLRDLEERFPTELAVVGVHSGKYTRERETGRIRDAANRLGVAHPVLNDRQFRTWRAYAVQAWPTIVLVDPRGYVIGQRAGEFTADQLAPAIQRLVRAADERGVLERAAQTITSESPAHAPGELRFPGKLAVQGDRIAIADSGHDRVLVGRVRDARIGIERALGGVAPGFVDGDRPAFRYPQGLAFDRDTLYVADAGNHAVRAVDLASGAVRTIAGTGTQFRTRADLDRGALSSPWDLAIVGRTLYVAMAGIHQLWSLDLDGGAARVHAGTRAEDIADGPNREAALAQPMGLATDGARLYFADAESSAIRISSLDEDGAVETIVGTGLFDFGDRDGEGDDVRMQHQQGLAVAPDGRLVVADSYNDALKWVDPRTRRAETLARGLHEPSGVAVAGEFAWVADTNAHRLVRVRLATGEIEEARPER
jgi:sugar lactone lactonase YvrE